MKEKSLKSMLKNKKAQNMFYLLLFLMISYTLYKYIKKISCDGSNCENAISPASYMRFLFKIVVSRLFIVFIIQTRFLFK